MDHDPSQSQPIVIPGHDNEQFSNIESTSVNQFMPESFQTARSYKTSPKEFQFSSSVNSTHSNLNNSYNYINTLRNPFTSASPTANFSPRADPPSYSQRNSIVDTGNSFNASSGFISGPRPSLLTSKLASSNSTQQLPLNSMKSPPNYDQSQFQNQGFSPQLNKSEFTTSSNIEIQPPSTSSHFKQSELVNSYTPYHNTPSVVSSSYSSAPNSVPNFSQGVSTSYPTATPQFTRNPEPTTNLNTEIAKPVDFSKQEYVEFQRPLKSPSFKPAESSSNIQLNQTNPPILDESNHLDIVNHPVDDLLLMLSALLQKIIEANDTLHPHHYHHASKFHDTNKFTANVLAFHGRNVPAISIHAYLSRILKYCPVTNEVFLTLLVYFDRIAKRANVNETNEGEVEEQFNDEHKNSLDNQLFVMDSYNIHRLIISGITVASKFFSDIFYKNSRYAKVGGLPLDELNHLELQFLLLLDFKLLIQIEELQRYADLLLKFWRREQAKKKDKDNDGNEELHDHK